MQVGSVFVLNKRKYFFVNRCLDFIFSATGTEMTDFETLQDVLAEANADEMYAFIGRNFSSINNGILIYALLSSVCLQFPCAYAFSIILGTFHSCSFFVFIFIQHYIQNSRNSALNIQIRMMLTNPFCKCRKIRVQIALLFVRKHVQWWWRPLTLEKLMVMKLTDEICHQ